MKFADELPEIQQTPDDPGINAEEAMELEQEIALGQTVASEEFQIRSRMIVAVEALDAMIEQKEKGAEASALEAFNLTGEMAAAGTFHSGRSIMHSQMSLEALLSRRKGLFDTIMRAIGNHFEKLVETVHYSLSIYNSQNKRVNEARKNLAETKVKTASVIIRAGKWYRFGDKLKPVQTTDEYIKELRDTAKTLNTLTGVVDELVNISLMGWWRFAASVATLSPAEFIETRMQVMKDQFEHFIKAARLRSEGSTHDMYETFASKTHLGAFQVEVERPDEENDIKIYSLHVERKHKFDLLDKASMQPQVALEVTHKQAEEILKISAELLESTRALGGLAQRFSYLAEHAGNFMGKNFEAWLLSKVSRGTIERAVMRFPLWVLKSHIRATVTSRVINALSGSVYDATAASYNLSFGNIRSALNIVERFNKAKA